MATLRLNERRVDAFKPRKSAYNTLSVAPEPTEVAALVDRAETPSSPAAAATTCSSTWRPIFRAS